MVKFQIESPTKAFLSGWDQKELESLREQLTYTNTAAAHDVKRHYNNKWLRSKDNDAWEKRLAHLKSLVKNTLIFAENGRLYIRPSSLYYLTPPKDIMLMPKSAYPEPKKIPWAKKLPFELHPYQQMSFEKLLEAKHANVELCTGAGKSAILLKLCRETGFRAAIVAPSASIFRELLASFETYLGKNNVGAFGDGKKKIGKRFTICIADSLVNVKKDTEEWAFFSGLDMLCVDESHTWGAETLENICHGIFADVPYRFFMSGTQTRGDGTEKLLQSIIGPTVHTLTTQEAIKGKYICPHNFTIVGIESSNPNFNSSEPIEMKRIHFLNNKNIAAFVARLANLEATTYRRQTLVLVEELSQIAMLKKLLTVPYAYAHSSKDTKTLAAICLEKVDSKEAVEKFNKNEVQVLIGTSCIATGTNIYPTHNTVNWVGGASEIRTKQGAVGRSVRLHDQNPFKQKCVEKQISRIWDFDIYDIFIMRRQLEERLTFYNESGTEVKRINLDAQKAQAGRV